MSENNFERIVIEDYKSDFLYKKKYKEIPAANAQNLSIIVNVTEYFSARYLERPSCVAKTRVAISMRAMPNLTF